MPEESQHNHPDSDAAAQRTGELSAKNSMAAGNSRNGSSAHGQHAIDREMEELRRLLIGNEGKHIKGLQARLNLIAQFEEEGQVEAMGRELPEAIAYHNKDNAKLANVLGPTIERTISVSIRRNPQPFADAIFPAIGPAIRRSIAEALRSMMESMNKVMEQSLSLRSVKWRMEAYRSGRSFSEVMLSHTINYRVEQLFLIDKKSGLLIQHLFADSVEVKDGDIVSSMLNAIQDFVRDSLGAPREEVLGAIEMGDLSVMIEPGPDAILAAVVRGIPTSELRTSLKEIIEAIHLQYGHLLDDFNGDTDPLTPVLPLLRAGLLENYKQSERKTSGMWWVAGLIFLGLAVWFAWSFRNYLMWNEYLDTLRYEPGLVVTQTSWGRGRFVVEGLRDPMAADPLSLLPEDLPKERVEGIWESYLALDSLIVIKRTAKQLRAPASIAFQVKGDTLFASGTASEEWITTARDRTSFIPGFSVFDDSGVVQDGAGELERVIDEIQRAVVDFSQGSFDLMENQNTRLDMLAATIRLLEEIGTRTGQRMEVLVYGSASTEGVPAVNQELRAKRAQNVREALIARGLPAEMIYTIITGDPRRPGVERTEAERAANRSVTFDVLQRN